MESGRAYEVPIALIASPSQFVICLPFGRGTNSARNVIAADGCDLRWKGTVHHATSSRVVGWDVALPLANRFERFDDPAARVRGLPAPAAVR